MSYYVVMDKFYTYIYYDNSEPFYVGKGKNNRVRAPKSRQVNERIKNVYCTIEVINTTNEFSALWLERVLIAAFGRIDRGTGPLLNKTDGGQGMSGHPCSPKVLHRMRTDNPMKPGMVNSATFRKDHSYDMSVSHRRNIREAKIGEKNPNYKNPDAASHLNIVKASCVNCRVITTVGNIIRWHGEKCRYI